MLCIGLASESDKQEGAKQFQLLPSSELSLRSCGTNISHLQKEATTFLGSQEREDRGLGRAMKGCQAEPQRESCR